MREENQRIWRDFLNDFLSGSRENVKEKKRSAETYPDCISSQARNFSPNKIALRALYCNRKTNLYIGFPETRKLGLSAKTTEGTVARAKISRLPLINDNGEFQLRNQPNNDGCAVLEFAQQQFSSSSLLWLSQTFGGFGTVSTSAPRSSTSIEVVWIRYSIKPGMLAMKEWPADIIIAFFFFNFSAFVYNYTTIQWRFHHVINEEEEFYISDNCLWYHDSQLPQNSSSSICNLVSVPPDTTNYVLWKYQISPILKAHKLFKYLDITISPPNRTIHVAEQPPQVNPESELWYEKDQKGHCSVTNLSHNCKREISSISKCCHLRYGMRGWMTFSNHQIPKGTTNGSAEEHICWNKPPLNETLKRDTLAQFSKNQA
ncbi:unnamed protein product [Citrullus colocynthis]|uniref:Uncharacterized protein n=1 Tax=Citrullus colocynthis TaxID=252529 RepID=A0ABP0Y8X7_9ROSI